MVGTLEGYVLSVSDLKRVGKVDKEKRRELENMVRELEMVGITPFIKGTREGLEVVALCKGKELGDVLCLDSLNLVKARGRV